MRTHVRRSAAVLAAVLFLCSVSQAAGGEGGSDLRGSVVQIFVQASAADTLSPWQSAGISSVLGSGVVIEGGRILTAAHVVTGGVSIEVKRQGQTRKYPAQVSFIAHACDLALLSVTDPSFFAGVLPVPLGRTPALEEEVKVYGFPVGGDTVSATSGIVSRIEVSGYTHSSRKLLLVQIDAAVNEGNSGGPVLAGGRLAGIAMQMLSDAENIGYMVPAAVIGHFLDDVADGRYDGFPRLGIGVQAMESPALREMYGLGAEGAGALVTRVSAGGPPGEGFAPGDVIISIDGVPVAEDLTVAAEGLGRLHFSHLVYSRQIGEVLPVEILRARKRHTLSVTLADRRPLVPDLSFGQEGTYFIVGGLVFRPVTLDYASAVEGEDDCYVQELDHYVYYHNYTTPRRDQLIVLSRVLPAPLNRGYQDLEEAIVDTVQGTSPRDMADLVKIIDSSSEKWLRVRMETGEEVVLDLARARAENGEILKAHLVPSDRSQDLAAGGKPAR